MAMWFVLELWKERPDESPLSERLRLVGTVVPSQQAPGRITALRQQTDLGTAQLPWR